MTRRECHLLDFPRIPGSDDLAPGVRVVTDQLDQVPDLVDVTAVRGLPVAPLLAIDRAEIAFIVGPLVPDADVAVLEPADVRVAAQEPEKLDDDRAEVQFLRRQQWKTLTEIE